MQLKEVSFVSVKFQQSLDFMHRVTFVGGNAGDVTRVQNASIWRGTYDARKLLGLCIPLVQGDQLGKIHCILQTYWYTYQY